VGFRRAKRIAQEEREQLADKFFSALSEIHEELNGIKHEALRLHQIDQGIATERDPWARQH
jgi:nucleotidyltransferase/DNA polymerase involved in DNA repair